MGLFCYAQKKKMRWEKGNTLNSKIQMGVAAFNEHVEPTSIATKDVVFEKEFLATPYIFLCIRSATTNYKYGGLTAFVNNSSKKGFTINVANNTETAFSPAVAWMALR